jgi:modulator of FtsH protease
METDKYRSSTTTGGIQSTALSPEVTKVLRSTYMLLGTTIAFSAIMAGISMAVDAPHFGLFTLLPYFVSLDDREE